MKKCIKQPAASVRPQIEIKVKVRNNRFDRRSVVASAVACGFSASKRRNFRSDVEHDLFVSEVLDILRGDYSFAEVARKRGEFIRALGIEQVAREKAMLLARAYASESGEKRYLKIARGVIRRFFATEAASQSSSQPYMAASVPSSTASGRAD